MDVAGSQASHIFFNKVDFRVKARDAKNIEYRKMVGRYRFRHYPSVDVYIRK